MPSCRNMYPIRKKYIKLYYSNFYEYTLFMCYEIEENVNLILKICKITNNNLHTLPYYIKNVHCSV